MLELSFVLAQPDRHLVCGELVRMAIEQAGGQVTGPRVILAPADCLNAQEVEFRLL